MPAETARPSNVVPAKRHPNEPRLNYQSSAKSQNTVFAVVIGANVLIRLTLRVTIEPAFYGAWLGFPACER